MERCLGLASHAERYPVVVMVEGLELRRCPFGKYLIFYAIVEDSVTIAHVIHSARDYMRLLFPDD